MPHREIPRDGQLNHRQPEHSHFLFEGVDYPVSRDELVELATASGFDVDVQNLVRALPDRDYLSRDEIWRSLAEARRRLGMGARIGKETERVGP